MLSYTHFTHDERISLHNFLKEGLGIREIACRLGRDPSTISREVKRNSSSKGYDFRSLSQAQPDVVVDLLNDRPRKCLVGKLRARFFLHLLDCLPCRLKPTDEVEFDPCALRTHWAISYWLSTIS